MALALSSSARLRPDIRLAMAVSQFEADLTSEQKASFRTQRSVARDRPPEPGDVMHLTASIDRCTASSSPGAIRHRCVGPRLTNFLQSVQQYVALGDVVVGGSQNLVACGVWALVRSSFLMVANHALYLEKLSLLFMHAGRSAPRYQQMALLYPRSKTLQANLAEYFIVVVSICHRVLRFTQKSYIKQLSSSLSDADLKQYQVDLDSWAAAIKDEVTLLMGQRIEDEARENSRFRAITARFSESAAHRKRVKERLVILDACSAFDHQTPWKQARKVGNTNLFSGMPIYHEWRRGGNKSHTIIYTGKLGSGKSVLLANIVDDLNLYSQADKIPVAYLFCRHDLPESLHPRAILGSLARQLLSTVSNLELIPPSWSTQREVDLDELLEYTIRAFRPKSHCYFVLDGLDECAASDRQMVLDHCKALQERIPLMLCVSLRLEADNRLALGLAEFASPDVVSIPQDNPEIKAYIDAELQAMIEEDRLSVGDPVIVLEIRDALLRGAQGMFLWVALQISSICLEKTDERIRAALQNLPRGLSETFSRILGRASPHDREYQRPILELVAVAYRPLTAEELREALSVVPGVSDWDPSRLINNIHATVACCGGLITVDEEEGTIRLVHHSVRQFLAGDIRDGAAFEFSLDEANRRMGRIILTYLSYNVFETQLSTLVVPEIVGDAAPRRIIDAVGGPGKSRALALKLLLFRRKTEGSPNPDYHLGRALAARSKYFKTKAMYDGNFAFHDYAKSFWPFHTNSVVEFDSFSHRVLIRLLEEKVPSELPSNPWDHGLPPLPWNHAGLNSPNLSLVIWKYYLPTIYWALRNSHLPLLRHQLKTKRSIKTVASVFIALNVLLSAPDSLRWHADMCAELLPFLILRSLKASAVRRNYLFTSPAIRYGRELPLEKLFATLDDAGAKAALDSLGFDCVLEASRRLNTSLVCFLLSKGADPGGHQALFPFLHAMSQSVRVFPDDQGSTKQFEKAAGMLMDAGAVLDQHHLLSDLDATDKPSANLHHIHDLDTTFKLLAGLSAPYVSPRFLRHVLDTWPSDRMNELLAKCCKATQGRVALTSMVMDYGADASAPFWDGDEMVDCLYLLLQQPGSDSMPMIELLMQRGASVLPGPEHPHRSHIEFCLRANKLNALRLFAKGPAERAYARHAVDKLGLLRRRVREQNFEQVAFFCSQLQVDVNVGHPEPLLLTALACPKPGPDLHAIVSLLADSGADINAVGCDGRVTLLDKALERVTCIDQEGVVSFHRDSVLFVKIALLLIEKGVQVESTGLEQVVAMSLLLSTEPPLAHELDGTPPEPNSPSQTRAAQTQSLPLLLQCLFFEMAERVLLNSDEMGSLIALLEKHLEATCAIHPSLDLRQGDWHLGSLKRGSKRYASELYASHIITLFTTLPTDRTAPSPSPLPEASAVSATSNSIPALTISGATARTKIENSVNGHHLTAELDEVLSISSADESISAPSVHSGPQELVESAIVRILARYFLCWDGKPMDWACNLPVYPLLQLGQDFHSRLAKFCSGMPPRPWVSILEPAIESAAAVGDVESARAGCALLMSKDGAPSLDHKVEEAERVRERLVRERLTALSPLSS